MKVIPLTGGAKNAHQSFSVLLGDHELTFRLDFMGYIDVPSWNLTIEEDEEVLVEGLLLRCGCDILGPYQLGLGKLVMIGEEPTLDNLGTTNQLVWVAEDEAV